MIRAIKLALACGAALVVSAGQVQAAVIISYQDVGSNLQFDFSGSLNVGTGLSFTAQDFATASLQQSLSAPVFYSANEWASIARDFSVTHTPGPFATNLPTFSAIQGTHSGTSFMFRLIGGDPGPASSVDLFGNWGAANTPISGQLILTGQSAAGIGMVDGWNLQASWGSITFQAAEDFAVIPEPSSFAIFGIGACVLGFCAARRHRRERNVKATT